MWMNALNATSKGLSTAVKWRERAYNFVTIKIQIAAKNSTTATPGKKYVREAARQRQLLLWMRLEVYLLPVEVIPHTFSLARIR